MRFTEAEQRALLEVANQTIAHGVVAGERPPPVSTERYPEALRAQRSSFVTLHLDGRLRGCVGAVEPHLPLVSDVQRHAYAAAFADPRFPPLTPAEHAHLEVSISVLSPAEPVSFEDEAQLLGQLRPGVDGLIVAHGEQRATFLPAVWASLEEPAAFVAELKRKAGIPAELRRYSAWRYTTASIPATGIGALSSAGARDAS